MAKKDSLDHSQKDNVCISMASEFKCVKERKKKKKTNTQQSPRVLSKKIRHLINEFIKYSVKNQSKIKQQTTKR